jgi:hypothetical protein
MLESVWLAVFRMFLIIGAACCVMALLGYVMDGMDK